MAWIAYAIAQETLPKYSHLKSPHIYTLPQLAACVLLGFHLDISYRDLEEWLLVTERVLEVLELKRVPDHTTLYRTYRKLRLEDWGRMRRVLLAELGVEGGGGDRGRLHRVSPHPGERILPESDRKGSTRWGLRPS